MSNIQFSKLGSAILKNKQLAEYITHRLANLSAEEKKRGFIEVGLDNGVKLNFRFGTSNVMASDKTKLALAS